MAYDALLWLMAPSETISTSNATRVGTLLAPSRAYLAELRMAGTPTGTAPTLDLTIQASATGSTAWSTLATFPQQTTSMTILNPENTTAASQSGVVRRAFLVDAARPYIHVGVAVGGTAPVFPNVSLVVVPMPLVGVGIAGA